MHAVEGKSKNKCKEKQCHEILSDKSCPEEVLNLCLLKGTIGREKISSKGLVTPKGDFLFEE